MKRHAILLLCALFFMGGTGFGREGPSVDLSSPKDRVLRAEQRKTALEVARTYLKEGGMHVRLEFGDIQSPYFFPEEQQSALEEEAEEEPEEEPARVVFDDASVLRAIANNLQNQVRGTMSRGEKRYLQLEGGALVGEGSILPARLPRIPDKTFRVTVGEIGPETYVLKLKDKVLTVPIESGGGSSGEARIYSD